MGTLHSQPNLPMLQAHFLVQGTTIGGTVAAPSGGAPVAWTLTDGTNYTGHGALLAAIKAAIVAASGTPAGDWGAGLFYSGTAYGLSISKRTGSGTFDLTLCPALVNYLGFGASYSAIQGALTFAVPSWWQAPLPITDADVVYRHVRSVSHKENGLPQGTRVALETDYEGTLHYTSGTVASFRSFLTYVGGGIPFRLYQRFLTTTVFTESNRNGYLDLILLDVDPSEQWANEPAATYGTYRLRGAVL